MTRRGEPTWWDLAGGFVAVAVVAAVVVAGVPQPATAACNGGAEFDGDRFVDQRGDVVAVRLDHCAIGDRTVEIEGDDYSATVTVRDGSGDDVVTVLVNSFAPGEEGLGVASPGDEVSVESVEGADGPLSTGEYDLRVVEVGYSQRTVEDEAAMVVENRSLGGLSVLAAPGGERSGLGTPAAIRTAVADGTVANRTPFVDDVAVVVLESSGLSGALAVQDGPNATARFLDLADGPLLSLHVLEHGSTVDTEENRVRLPVDHGGPARVVPDATNDTYYLLVDLAAARAREAADGDGREVEVGDAFVATVAVPADSPLAAGPPENVTARFEVTRRRAALSRDDRPVFLLPGENLTVNGTTNVRPGRTLTVAVEEPGPVGSFRRRTPVTVGPDGGFATTVDLRHREDGTNLTLSVRLDGEGLLADPLRVLVDEPSASVTIDDQSLDAGSVTVSRVSLSRPGFVAVHLGGPRGTYLGVSDPLARGSHEDVRVPVDASALPAGDSERVAAVVYHDADRNGAFDGPNGTDPAVERDRRAVNDRAALDVSVGPTPTPGTPTVTPTLAPPGTPTDTAGVGTERTPPGTTPPDADADAGDSLPVPGFGAVPALVAASAALVLARRS